LKNEFGENSKTYDERKEKQQKLIYVTVDEALKSFGK